MRRRKKKGGLGCRPPRIWQLCLVIFITGNLLRLGEACKDNEALQCNTEGDPSDCSCIKCPSCPPGEGLYPQCGNTILKGNMTMECRPCQRGMYSDKHDFGACNACEACYGQEILRECNATHNRICKEGCKDGFQQNDNYPMCQKIPHTTSSTSPPNPTAEPSTEMPTVKIFTPSTNSAPGQNQFMSTTRMKQTATLRARSWPTPNGLIPTVIPTAMPSNNSGLNRTGITHIERIARTPDFVYVLGILLPFALVLLLALIIFKKWDRIKPIICHLFHWNNSNCSSMNDNQIKDTSEAIPMITIGCQDEERRNMDIERNISSPRLPNPPGQDLEQNVTSDQHTVDKNAVLSPPKYQVPIDDQNAVSSLQSSQDPLSEGRDLEKDTISSVPEQQRASVEEAMMRNISDLDSGLLLCELTHELKSKISVKISKVGSNGWKEIGGRYKIPKDKIEEIETRCSYGSSGSKIPGEYLFDVLASNNPNLSLKDFTEVLHSIKRYDVINDILAVYVNK